MKRNNKKGFTIVELVIVIAVIAILSAVLIPTFAGIVKKARMSADQQAVAQMNTLIKGYDDVTDIADLKAKLNADGIDADNYKPMTVGAKFFWNGEIIVLKNGNEVYPKGAKVDGDLFSLDAENKEAVAKVEAGVLTGAIDMQGASVNITPTNGFVLGAETGTATIKNVVSDEGSKAPATNSPEFANNTYYSGLISTVDAGKTVTVQNLVIDGAVIGESLIDSAQAGIIAGQVNGTLIIKNVTIKNSKVFGEYKVGALVGQLSGKLVIENVTLQNVTVEGDTQTARLVGSVYPNAIIEMNGTNDFTGVTVTAKGASTVAVTVNGDNYSASTAYAGEYEPIVTTKNFWIWQGSTSSYLSNAPAGYEGKIWNMVSANAK